MREIKFRAWNGHEMHYNVSIIKGSAVKDGYAATWWEYLIPIVMQYTSLKDAAGREIYEGDILRISDRCDNQVVYYGEGFYGTDEFALFELTCDTTRSIEVIGNIYENPELLGE